eukprot:1156605-Pelagomonas_calceolata.AAC.6
MSSSKNLCFACHAARAKLQVHGGEVVSPDFTQPLAEADWRQGPAGVRTLPTGQGDPIIQAGIYEQHTEYTSQ